MPRIPGRVDLARRSRRAGRATSFPPPRATTAFPSPATGSTPIVCSSTARRSSTAPWRRNPSCTRPSNCRPARRTPYGSSTSISTTTHAWAWVCARPPSSSRPRPRRWPRALMLQSCSRGSTRRTRAKAPTAPFNFHWVKTSSSPWSARPTRIWSWCLPRAAAWT